jgi:hypothetical protein
MADRFYGIAIGGMTPADVTESGSTTSKAVEIRVSDTAYASKQQVLNAIEALENYLITRETTPIA